MKTLSIRMALMGKVLNLLFFIILIINFSISASTYTQKIKSLKELDHLISIISTVVKTEVPKNDTYISGSLARDLIAEGLKPFFDSDHLNFRLRDLDLNILSSKHPDHFDTRAFIKALAKEGLRVKSFSGQTITMIYKDLPVDVTFFSNEKVLLEKGVFDIDTIKLSVNEGLIPALTALQTSSKPVSEIISDPLDVLESFQNKTFAPNETKHTFDHLAIRAVRTVFKIGAPENHLPASILTLLEERRTYRTIRHKQILRWILMLLTDKEAVKELKWLAELGVISTFSPSLEQYLKSTHESQIKTLFFYDLSYPSYNVFEVFIRLTDLMSEIERESLLKVLAKIRGPQSPGLASFNPSCLSLPSINSY